MTKEYDEIKINGEARGKTTHYTWLPINYCPCCGVSMTDILKIVFGEDVVIYED